MLRITNLEVTYGDFQVLWGVSLEVRQGEVVCLLGPNGAGKSTIMNSVTGLVRPKAGEIEYCGQRITGMPTHRIVHQGISHVLERRRVFPYLSVKQNLILGAFNGEPKRRRQESLGRVFELFPILKQRQDQAARTLSGGEQQMLAIGRGLMGLPKFLMIDEPFLGLSPLYERNIIDTIRRLNAEGMTILFIEQNVQEALLMSHRGYILESGRVALEGTGEQLLRSDEVRKVYMGA